MIKQYYSERLWKEGMPLFHELSEKQVEHINNFHPYQVWRLTQALKEFGSSVKEVGRRCRIASRKLKKK